MNKTSSKTVLKALKIIEELSGADSGLTNSEIANRVKINPSTCYRLLSTLKNQGYISKEDNLYRLGYKIFQIKGLNNNKLLLKKSIEPFLIELEEKFGCTINLGIRRGDSAVPIEIIEGSKNLVVNKNIGVPAPLYASSLGKCFLAFIEKEIREFLLSRINLNSYTQNTITQKSNLINELEKVRNQGYAVDKEEYIEGIVCVGVPILNKNGEPIFAISISVPKTSINEDAVESYVTSLKKTGKVISKKFLGA